MSTDASHKGVKVLVTGANGFMGSHLMEYLLGKGDVSVFGLVRSRSDDQEKIQHLTENPNLKLLECDLTDTQTVTSAMENIVPDYIFHLAAQSFVPVSWSNPQQTIHINVIGAVNLLEAVRKHAPEARVFMCGSAEEYGLVPLERGPIKETDPLEPNSPYGASKVAQELFAKVAFQAYGTKVCLARPFAHEGPRRGKEFATSDFALQIIAIERGARKEPIIYYGNLETFRDYTHVLDMVRMYEELMHTFVPGEAYNLSSGRESSIKDVIETYIKVSGLKGVRLERNPKFTRPTQASYLVGNPEKVFKAIKFRPTLTLEDICRDMLHYWRERFDSLPDWKA